MENILSKQFQRQYEMMIEWVNGTIDPLSDEEFNMELSSGKNHGVWLLGHLVTSDDDFSMFMGKGEVMFPQYYEVFGQGSKLLPNESYPPVSELKDAWKKVCDKNRKIYSELTDDELQQPHALVKDFEKDYFKTKERVIMAWQLHQLYHAGQLGILVARSGKSKY
jgi:hypothetical protein